MPIKNAIEVILELRQYFNQLVDREGFQILEPTYAILTAFATPQFKQHLSKVSIDVCYEKPM